MDGRTSWAVVAMALMIGGCAPYLGGTYPYRVINDGCNCERYVSRDPHRDVRYLFVARYRIEAGVISHLEIEILNGTEDTVDLSLAHVRVTSRNVPYRFNGRFLPVTAESVPPRGKRVLTLQGETEEDESERAWLRIAGEELVVTLKGIRVREQELATQVVRFVPHNPRLGT